MDCCAISSATSYPIKTIFESLRQAYGATLSRDVIHIPYRHETPPCDIFVFAYGVAVFWGVNKETAWNIIKSIPVLEDYRVDFAESDEFTYAYGDVPKIVEDEIILPNDEVITKLAISHGLAQSVKLEVFESKLQKTFNSTRAIPENLAEYGKIPLSRKEIQKKMGELFLERNSINLYMDVLDTPEFFWEYPELEPLYMMTANYLDIRTRVEVLNQRLDVIHNLFEMLATELNHKHSSRLEITIISLIVIEVLIALLKDVFHVI